MAITDRSSLFNRIGIIIFPHKANTKTQRTQRVPGSYDDFERLAARNESEGRCRPGGQDGLRRFCGIGREVDQREDEDCHVGEAALDPIVHVSLQC